MLPSVVAHELQLSLHDYLRAAFPMSSPVFRGKGSRGETALIDRFLDEPHKLIKGPYLSLGLPFRRDDTEPPFRYVNPGFPPYRHQQRAFTRLCGENKRSTLVATGTGSGKTECFLLPILEHCLAVRQDPAQVEKRGIKALLIYPMNALATDQARRFAKEVHKLDTRLTVGLFTGEQPSAPAKVMGPESVITCKDTLRASPPDILLTNYKMLDFLLLRPRDQELWRFNSPGTLQYLVVDELHTFDGAQGTDLACLIRRLRDRLKAGPELACVGTSATIGGPESGSNLRSYAEQIFASHFDDDSLIREDRLSSREYLEAATRQWGEIAFTHWPTDLASLRQLDPHRYDSPEAYLASAFRQWFVAADEAPVTDPQSLADGGHSEHTKALVTLGQDLRRHQAFHQLLLSVEGVTDLAALIERWQAQLNIPSHAETLLYSLLALVSAARNGIDKGDGTLLLAPLLNVRLQLWLRELSRMVASVDDAPQLNFADDRLGDAGDGDSRPLQLPLVHCRECHAGAWGTLKRDDEPRITQDLSAFYREYFQQGPNVCLLYPLGENGEPPEGDKALIQQLCAECGALSTGTTRERCAQCESQQLKRVWRPNLQDRKEHKLVSRTDHCPWCQAHNGLAIVGFRAASLSSTLLARLYQSTFNDDRKAIAFSDSVQDAAHRAGFFEARTWSQALRQALDTYLTGPGQGAPLDQLGKGFANTLRQAAGSDANFVGRWLSPNMEWLQDAESLLKHQSLPPESDLPELVARRLDWEVHTELGLRSQIGRTLERQGRVTLEVDQELLAAAAERLARDWQQELPGIGEVSEYQARRFLLGMLHRLRVRGAFEHPEIRDYLKEGGNTWFFQKSRFLPGYGPRSAPPAFLSVEPAGRHFDSILGGRNRWYASWFLKQLEADQAMAGDIAQAYRLALRSLESVGLLTRPAQIRQHALWALARPHWRAVAQPVPLRCESCGQRHHVPPHQLMIWQQMACFQPHCRGTLQAAEHARWELRPSRSMPTRLVSHEHTGLLDTDTRAWVEDSFINGDRPWDINLLSATPTLEMGIDIGDLSSVLLCSTPPAQANYLQRIGRAGRRDGNALNVTIANAAPHDLYFYAEPEEMMAGAVQTPGVFLQATSVLERQLLAYSFDHWVADANQHGQLGEQMLPPKLLVVLDNIQRDGRQGFPYPLLDFIHTHHERLLEGFCNLFPQLGEEAREHLREFIEGGDTAGLGLRILNRLTDKAKQRESWRSTINEYKKRLDKLRREPDDEANREAIEAITTERDALMHLSRRLNAQQTLNFFTDEGLLPNYAFPEEGVTLTGVVLRSVSKKQRQDGGKPYEVVSYDFQRPAQNALVELAPENTFYAVGRALKIDQVNVRLNEVEHWRLCNHCHYSENLAKGDVHGACPRCGSPQWADAAQKRQLLRLREVTANVRDRDSRIGDETEQREPSFYTRQMLTDIAPGSAHFAYRIDDPECPFGFEYVPQARFVEINFGRHDEQAPALSVAGEERPRSGFKVCKHCGKVQRRGMKANDKHQRFCKLARTGAVEHESDFLDSLFLYRELSSEALRLLLPLSDVAMSDEARHSLIAAIHLGLKAHFHGNVDHLRITEQQTPGNMQGPSRHYLVIYDSVPGGTGYLKELMHVPESLLAMLEAAYRVLHDCACQDEPHRDGCYRCLLAYRESRHMAQISRQLAIKLLGRILERREQLIRIDGLDKVDLNALVESELEQRFIDLLPTLDPDLHLVPELVEGKPGWRLTLRTGQDALTSWRIEPQRNLGPGDDVLMPTRPDFMLWPAAENNRKARPVALYLDGFQYHHDQIDDDTTKRQAVLASNRFHVWTLGWRDLERNGKELAYPLWEARAPFNLGEAYKPLVEKLGLISRYDSLKALKETSLKWLLCYLRAPAETALYMGQAGIAQAFEWLDQRTLRQPELLSALDLELQENAPSSIRRALLPGDDTRQLLGGVMSALGNSDGTTEAAVGISFDALTHAKRLRDELHVHLSFDDRQFSETHDGEIHWRRFWHAANLLQFMPRFSMCSTRGVARRHASEAIARHSLTPCETQRTEAGKAPADTAGWDEVMEMTLLPPEWVRTLKEHGLPCPTPGLERLDTYGEASIVLELAWEEARVAVVIEEEQPAGWQDCLVDWRLVTETNNEAIVQLHDWLHVDQNQASAAQGVKH